MIRILPATLLACTALFTPALALQVRTGLLQALDLFTVPRSAAGRA